MAIQMLKEIQKMQLFQKNIQEKKIKLNVKKNIEKIL